MSNDDRLRGAFQAVRDAERPDAPPFGRVLAGRRRGPGRGRLVRSLLLAGGAVAGLAIALMLSQRANPARDLELARRVMAWRSPTDFLLPPSAPGLLSSVPRIGRAEAGSPLQALDPGNVLGPPILSRSPRS